MVERLEHPDPPDIAAWIDAQAGDVAWDVGANVGVVTARLADRFRVVHAFEPNRDAFDELAGVAFDLVAAGRDIRVWPHALTVPNTERLILAARSESIRSGQYVAAGAADVHGWGDVVEHVRVDATWGDRFGWEYGCPDFVKVDVEGGEVDVLTGMVGMLTVARPTVLVECHSAELGVECARLLGRVFGSVRVRRVDHSIYTLRGDTAMQREHFFLVAGENR